MTKSNTTQFPDIFQDIHCDLYCELISDTNEFQIKVIKLYKFKMSAPERRRYRDQMFKLFLFTSGSSFVAASLSWQKRFNTFMVLGAPNGFLLLTPLQVQSYEIKSPPWTILWFRILGIFSVENIKRLCVFMFQT